MLFQRQDLGTMDTTQAHMNPPNQPQTQDTGSTERTRGLREPITGIALGAMATALMVACAWALSLAVPERSSAGVSLLSYRDEVAWADGRAQPEPLVYNQAPIGAGTTTEHDQLRVTVLPQSAAARPGDQLAVAVVLDFPEHRHAWPNVPVIPPELEGLFPIPTELSLLDGVPKELSAFPASAQWPEPVKVSASYDPRAGPTELLSYEGRSIVYLPVIVSAGAAPGRYTLPLRLSIQICDERNCYAPQDVDLSAVIAVSGPGQGVVPEHPASVAGLFAGFDATVFGRLQEGGSSAGAAAGAGTVFNFFGVTFKIASTPVILVLAFVAGIIMNFTPCVLPVIPIKILSLQQHAKSPGKLALFGSVYCVGIVFTYLVLGLFAFGLVTGGQKFDWGQIFTSAYFSLAMAGIIGVLGLGMVGLFEIKLPNAVYMINPAGDTPQGNFMLGALTGILAVPCTGPLLGGALAWAATQAPAMGLFTFVVMGVGMAAPYALLIAFPGLISKLPRGGPGGVLLKQVVGVLMLAVAAFLAGNITTEKWPWYVVGAVCAVAALWAIVGAWVQLRKAVSKVLATAGGLAALPLIALTTAGLVDEGPIDWRRFEGVPDEEIRAAIKDELTKGNTVVVDFTAKWCTNCHVIEKQVLLSEGGVKVLRGQGVVPFKVDLTSAPPDQKGWGLVKEVSIAGGIPLIAVFGPGQEKPVYFQSFFTVAALSEAVLQVRARQEARSSGAEGTAD